MPSISCSGLFLQCLVHLTQICILLCRVGKNFHSCYFDYKIRHSQLWNIIVTDNRKILLAELLACEGCESQVREILSEYATHVRAETGNQVFDCYQTQEEPRRFVVYEIYDDEAAFQAHLSAPMNAEINQRLSSVTEGGSSLTFLTPFT